MLHVPFHVFASIIRSPLSGASPGRARARAARAASGSCPRSAGSARAQRRTPCTSTPANPYDGRAVSEWRPPMACAVSAAAGACGGGPAGGVLELTLLGPEGPAVNAIRSASAAIGVPPPNDLLSVSPTYTLHCEVQNVNKLPSAHKMNLPRRPLRSPVWAGGDIGAPAPRRDPRGRNWEEPSAYVLLHNDLFSLLERINVFCPEGVAVLLAVVQVGPHLRRDGVRYPVDPACARMDLESVGNPFRMVVLELLDASGTGDSPHTWPDSSGSSCDARCRREGPQVSAQPRSDGLLHGQLTVRCSAHSSSLIRVTTLPGRSWVPR